MDIHTGLKTAVDALNQIIQLHDKLFVDICPITDMSILDHVSMGDQQISIDRNILSLYQMEQLKHLSGYIKSAKSGIDAVKYHYYHEGDDDTLVERLEYLEKVIVDKDRQLRLEEQRTALLKEYLVNEVNRADALEQGHKIVEDELVLVNDERVKLFKRLQSYQAAAGQGVRTSSQRVVASGSTAAVASQDNDNASKHKEEFINDDLVNKYVRKKFGSAFFFGVVLRFLTPYFTVGVESTFVINYYYNLLMHTAVNTNCRLFTKTVTLKTLQRQSCWRFYGNLPSPIRN